MPWKGNWQRKTLLLYSNQEKPLFYFYFAVLYTLVNYKYLLEKRWKGDFSLRLYLRLRGKEG